MSRRRAPGRSRLDFIGGAQGIGGFRVRSAGLTRMRRLLGQPFQQPARDAFGLLVAAPCEAAVPGRAGGRRHLRLRRDARESVHSELRVSGGWGLRAAPGSGRAGAQVRARRGSGGDLGQQSAWRVPCQPPIRATASRRPGSLPAHFDSSTPALARSLSRPRCPGRWRAAPAGDARAGRRRGRRRTPVHSAGA
jgi:hypothetical protein